MMGYIFLFIAVFTGVAKGYCGKKTSNYVNTITDGLILQYTRLTLCMFIGICLFLFSKNTFQMNIPILFISMLNGIANASFLIAWLFAVKSGAYLFVDICLTAHQQYRTDLPTKIWKQFNSIRNYGIAVI